MLLGYVSFYAKYTDWSGDTAWGDRYTATAAQMVALMAVPLLLRHRATVGRIVWRAGLGLIFVSVVIQLSSVAFWCPLERYQLGLFEPPTFVVWLRLKNIVAFASGKMSDWGLMSDDMIDDKWDYVHVTTWNFLPFVLKRVGEAPAWVVEMLTALWFALLAALASLLVLAGRPISKKQFDLASGSSR